MSKNLPPNVLKCLHPLSKEKQWLEKTFKEIAAKEGYNVLVGERVNIDEMWISEGNARGIFKVTVKEGVCGVLV